MTRREAALSALGVFGVALVVRALVAAAIVFPMPEDTAYYVGVARNILEGRGLVSDAIWTYATPPLVFPRPAFEIWLPLPALLAVVPMGLFGTSFGAAQVSSVLAGSIVPVLAWRLAADVADERRLPVGRSRTLALGTGLTTAVYLPLVLHSALPDSTILFAALALGCGLVMSRLLRDPAAAARATPRLAALGILLGLAALTRNEAIWVALAWAGLVWFGTSLPVGSRVRMIGVVAVAALLVFSPWGLRNWAVFGNPLPGQAALNALSVHGTDIFAWGVPVTLERYLAVGPGGLLEQRLVGLEHNLISVLLLPGVPLALLALVGVPMLARTRAVRPILLAAVVTFVFTTLVFPVATTWGTYLHAAGPAHVVVVIGALLALDAGFDRLGRARRWTRPVAWLGPTLGVAGSLLLSFSLLGVFARDSVATAARFDAVAARMAELGRPLDASAGPVISNFPVWVAESNRISALALPDEPPGNVLDLAHAFRGVRYVVLVDPSHDHWPTDVDAGAPSAECFSEVDLMKDVAGDPETDPLATVRVFEIVCP